VGHSHQDSRPLGIVDIVAGAVVFLALAWLVISVAGPDGMGFLKNLLTVERSIELISSGLLFIAVWFFVGELVAKPYLENHYAREEKTSGTQLRNQELKKEIEQLRLDIVSELRTARLEGIRRRDEIVADAKRKSQTIIDTGRADIEKEWEKITSDLETARRGVYASLDSEVPGLVSLMYGKVLKGPLSNSSRVLHSLSILFPLGVLFSPFLAHAASSAHVDAGIDTLLYPALNFSIYCLVVFWICRKFVRPVLRNFRAEVESVAVRVQNEFVTLERELDQLRFKLEHISSEKEELVRELEKSGHDLSGEIIVAAEEKLAGMKRDMLLRAKSEEDKMHAAAKNELLKKVMVQVKEKLSRGFGEEDDRALIRTMLSDPGLSEPVIESGKVQA
jgi:F0F1-type ATP synthase membrane subunit b/b'